MRTIAIIGTSLAGLRCAQELRSQGYGDRLVLIGDESYRPYDRPPLSKDFLLGKVGITDLELAPAEELLDLEAQWWLGSRAQRLDPAGSRVLLDDGSEIATDGVVIATGAQPKTLEGAAGLRGVHTLRTLTDALALRAQLIEGQGRVVIIGAGFIGAEVASTVAALGCSVTIVEGGTTPMSGALGPRMGAVCGRLHADHGVELRTGVGVAGLLASTPRCGEPAVTGVALADGSELPADVVVLGIGARPNTDWLTGSGLTVDDGVRCDAGCVTSNPRVVAVGDVARYDAAPGSTSVRGEHWSAANQQPVVAVRNLLAGTTIEHFGRPSYFWSEQYGVRLQFAGSAGSRDPSVEVKIVDGAVEDRKFVATYHKGEMMIGVLAMNNSRTFGRLRRELGAAAVVAR